MLVNRAFCEMLQLEEEALIGKTDFDVYPESMAEVFAKDDQIVLDSGEAFWNKLEIVTRKMGGVEWKMTSKIPLMGKGGEVIGTSGVCRRVVGMGGP